MTMKVKYIMMGTPASCTPETNLGSAVEIMWNRNCGILPVVDAQQEVIGVVTDRDICVALGTRNRLPGEITVREVASFRPFTCTPEDDISTALKTMTQGKVRRLPVVNPEGKLEGILSMDDIVLHSDARNAGRASELTHDNVVETLQKVYTQTLPRVLEH